MFKLIVLLWLITVLIYGLKLNELRLCRWPDPTSGGPAEKISLSVIIPFRNEALNLPLLLQSLKRALPVDYPVELIGVDDFSQDDSVNVFRQYARGLDFRLLESSPESASPKRDAQSRGIAEARGDWILLLDADTQVPKGYFQALKRELLSRPVATFRPGPVVLDADGGGFWPRWQQYENLWLQSLTHFSARCGNALMANGAHLVFRKDRFMALGGFSDAPAVAGGDDMYLLLAWKRRFPGEILPLDLQPELMVHTRAVSGFGSLLRQRLRWARKSRRLNDARIRRWALWQSLVFTGFFASIVSPHYWIMINLMWMSAEYALTEAFRRKSAYRMCWVRELIYHFIRPVVYLIVFIGVWLPVPVRWKGRRFAM